MDVVSTTDISFMVENCKHTKSALIARDTRSPCVSTIEFSNPVGLKFQMNGPKNCAPLTLSHTCISCPEFLKVGQTSETGRNSTHLAFKRYPTSTPTCINWGYQASKAAPKPSLRVEHFTNLHTMYYFSYGTSLKQHYLTRTTINQSTCCDQLLLQPKFKCSNLLVHFLNQKLFAQAQSCVSAKCDKQSVGGICFEFARENSDDHCSFMSSNLIVPESESLADVCLHPGIISKTVSLVICCDYPLYEYASRCATFFLIILYPVKSKMNDRKEIVMCFQWKCTVRYEVS